MKLSFCNNLCTEHNDLAVNCGSVYILFSAGRQKAKGKAAAQSNPESKVNCEKKISNCQKVMRSWYVNIVGFHFVHIHRLIN